MSRTSVKRKVARWESYQPPRRWTAYLECGHLQRPVYDDAQLLDEDKARIEKDGYVQCYECGEKKDKIAELKRRLKDLQG